MSVAKTDPMARTRLTFDVSDRVRRALNIAASRKAKTLGQVLEWMMTELLADDLASADRSIAEDEPHKSKPGRKPKPEQFTAMDRTAVPDSLAVRRFAPV